MLKGRGRKGGVPPHSRKPSVSQEAHIRAAMNVGTQVVSNVQSVSPGTATYATQNAPTPIVPLYAAPYFNNPSAGAITFPYSPGFTPTQGYDPWNMHPHMYSYPSPGSFPSAVDNSTDVTVNTFSLCFIKGNISVCIGCKNRYEKNSQPPNDLCIKHHEWREFTPVGSETSQSKFANVMCYLHFFTYGYARLCRPASSSAQGVLSYALRNLSGLTLPDQTLQLSLNSN